jgi:hypothetical protein
MQAWLSLLFGEVPFEEHLSMNGTEWQQLQPFV